MRHFAGAIVIVSILWASSVNAATVIPDAASSDSRVRIVSYDPNNVVLLTGTLGYQISIEFGAGEQIENVSIGDSLGWQVTPNRRANLLFIKPRQRNAVTNMSVYTNLRRYMFDLRVRAPRRADDRDIIFSLRFEYPEPAPALVIAQPGPQVEPEPVASLLPNEVNRAYTYEGSSKNLPTRVFDDDRATYFTFPATADYPAIFALDADDQEAVVNVTVRDGYVIIDQLARGFVLRRGNDVTRIYNDGYKEAPSPSSLQPHKDSRGLLNRLFR